MLLLLVVLRLGWRMRTGVPLPADTRSALEHRLAGAGHAVLYALMIAIPLSGWWISDTSRIPFKLFGVVQMPDFLTADKATSEFAASVHEALIITLVAMISIHVLAALRHHFWLGNSTLRRMLPFTSNDR
jgi:cytochrome b561